MRLLSKAVPAGVLFFVPAVLTWTVGTMPTAAPEQAVLAERSTLAHVFETWEKSYEQQGGDRNVVVSLGAVTGLSTISSTAHGRARLDLMAGTVQVSVTGPARGDVWLVHNVEGEGRSFLPEDGDNLLHLGTLAAQGESWVAQGALGRDFFDEFRVDLIVVSEPQASPVHSRVLLGARPLFERLHTQRRIGEAGAQAALAALLRTAARVSPLVAEPAHASDALALSAAGMVSAQVARGADVFFRELFAGNGRTCGTCHPAANNLALDLAFVATLPASDALFVAERSADQGGVPGLERPALMRSFAVILENVDGLEDPTRKLTMRGVPHTLSMLGSLLPAPDPDGDGVAVDRSTTNVVQRTGWSGDGAPGNGSLRLFAAGAVVQHFTKTLQRRTGVDFRLPTDEELDAMEAFQLASGRLNELNLSAVAPRETRAERGRVLFLGDGKCNLCHANAGANVGAANFNFNSGVERLPHPARTPGSGRFIEDFPLDGGFDASALFDSDGDGIADSFGNGTFNTPPLVEAADTPPFFHNNAVATLDEAVEFYSTPTFNNSPAGQTVAALTGSGIQLTAEQSADVSAFLRVLNAGFNTALAIQRNQAAFDLDSRRGSRQTINGLLRLSNAEIDDAVQVLEQQRLSPIVRFWLVQAKLFNEAAIDTPLSLFRRQFIQGALVYLNQARADLGTGLDFVLGEGNLVF